MKKKIYWPGFFCLLAAGLAIFCAPVPAAEVKLAWNPPESGATPTGYLIRYTDGANQYVVDAGNALEASVPVAAGIEYRFTAHAYNADVESGPSNEIVHTAPVYAPPEDSRPNIIEVSAPVTLIIVK